MTNHSRPYGSGSIKPAGVGKWIITAENGRKADGKRRRKSRTIQGTKADAERELVRLRLEMGARPNLGDSMTLGEYFEDVFLPSRRTLLRQKTLDTYTSVYRCHIADYFGAWPMDEIRRVDVQRWVTRLPSPATAAKAYRHLRAILRAAWDDELLDDEPLRRRIKIPRHTVAPKGVWSEAELMEALDRLRGKQLEALVLAMAGGGLRREEALGLDLPEGLQFGDVLTMDGATHIVCRAIIRSTWVEGEAQANETKTYRARPVTIGEPFAPRLQEIVRDGRPKLIMTRDGRRPLTPSSVPETWRRAFGEGRPLYGMRYVELRTLRHCHETLSARAGITDAVNSTVHGHSAQVMYDHYLTLGADDADAVAEAIRSHLAAR